ncbi:MAG: prepilin-type N-terminal cleavage/methylation domain-containing protein [Pseudomonadota bacterium]
MSGAARIRALRGDGGFTLLEVLVAFSLVALMLGAAYATWGAGSRAAERSERSLAALSRAESVLARLGADLPLVPGEQRLEEPGWAIRIAVTPYGRARAAEAPQLGLGAYDVRVTVRERGGSGAQARLATILLGGTS